MDPLLFIRARQIDPICTVADRREADLDSAPNGVSRAVCCYQIP
ncbi:MAG: hypothetical protein WAL72_00875 [Streptosporangiaceae bacterium]